MPVEEIPQAIPQGKPYKLARKIVEHKETSIKKSDKHLIDCLEKWTRVADVTLWFVTSYLKKFLHCRSNLQRSKNVIPPVITKFLSKRKWKNYRCNSKAKLHRRRSTLTLLISLIKTYKTFMSLLLSNFPLHKITSK